EYPQDKLHVLVTKSNSNSFTYDGIELGGERTANEVEEEIKKLEEGGNKITKISIVGYSLGGLVARYVVGLLYSKGYFDRIQPVNFTTFATPHLGVRSPLLGPHNYLWNVLGARTLSTSGRQLFTVDSFRDTGRPLLTILADPNSVFIRGLAQFKHRTLYSNIVNDRSVVYYTSCITYKDPFVNIDAVDLQPLPGYDGVLLRPDEPVRPKPRVPLGFWARVRSTGWSTLTAVPLYLLLAVLIPVGSMLFLINSGYQTIRSAQRVRLHESGGANFGIERYRSNPLLEEAQNLEERVFDRLDANQGQDYLPTPPSEDEERFSKSEHSGSKFKGQEKFPTLALTSDQFYMIEGLDGVGFTKYPVHISKVRHTHAAIIVRTNRWGFDEGKVVVGHWVKHFEV
ncbi:lipid particle protein, partial [Aureobasidium pullulans]